MSVNEPVNENDHQPNQPHVIHLPAPIGVYVSASSAEMDRAEKWMTKLREKGIPVNSTWLEVVKSDGKGIANPRDASVEDKQKWALKDVQEAITSQIFWLLMPVGPHSFGASFEMGFFVALANDSMQGAVVSGDYKRTIFTSFAECFDTDEEAFEQIVGAFKQMGEEQKPVEASSPISFNPNATR